jgi:hypothetical protein
MIKYIMPNSKDDEYIHHKYCEKNKYPFITVKKQGSHYAEIFYDITNTKLCLKSLSENIGNFYKAYIEFVHIPIYDIQDYLDNMYTFYFIVKIEDADFVASRLFDYLMIEINNISK